MPKEAGTEAPAVMILSGPLSALLLSPLPSKHRYDHKRQNQIGGSISTSKRNINKTHWKTYSKVSLEELCLI